ncbi:MAG: hypothetical protein JSS56_23135 [Proteobacteria bacterium]|nr:hypothetical protein [Pseudomonadota bacterium]
MSRLDAPGVSRRDERGHAVYSGSAEALMDAGLVQAHELPGQAGNPRGMVTVDGAKRVVACVREGEPRLEVWTTLADWPFPVAGGTFMGHPVESVPAPAPVVKRRAPSIRLELTDEQCFFVAQLPSAIRALRERTTGALPPVLIDLNEMRITVGRTA